MINIKLPLPILRPSMHKLPTNPNKKNRSNLISRSRVLSRAIRIALDNVISYKEYSPLLSRVCVNEGADTAERERSLSVPLQQYPYRAVLSLFYFSSFGVGNRKTEFSDEQKKIPLEKIKKRKEMTIRQSFTELLTDRKIFSVLNSSYRWCTRIDISRLGDEIVKEPNAKTFRSHLASGKRSYCSLSSHAFCL